MTKAFLIGAGATRAEYEKAPLSADFFKQLKNRHGDLFRHIKATIEQHISTSLEESNVEEVMISSYNFPQSIKTAFLESLYMAINILIAEPTNSHATFINEYLSGRLRYKPTLFKTLLTDNRLDKNDFFMALNYDLYLDREILYIQNKIDYGIGNEFNISSTNINISNEQNFSIYHLHGSLNWELFSGNRLDINIGAINPKHVRTGSNLCLIPPGKKELNPILKSIWEIAEKRLLDAEELIIIGCSLNPDDTELINLLKKFINKNGTKKIKLVYKSTSTLKDTPKEDYHYKNIIGDGFKGFPYGFTALSKNLVIF